MKLNSTDTTNYLTASGRELDVLKPHSFEPCIEEVVESLPKINRFNGHTCRPYSVAAHSMACFCVAYNHQKLTKPHLLLAILLHDAAEAYIGDIVRPIKRSFHPDLHDCEEAILRKILTQFNLTNEQYRDIYSTAFIDYLKILDTRMALTEIKHLMPNVDHNTVLPEFDAYDCISLPHTTDWRSESIIFRFLITELQSGNIPDYDWCIKNLALMPVDKAPC